MRFDSLDAYVAAFDEYHDGDDEDSQNNGHLSSFIAFGEDTLHCSAGVGARQYTRVLGIDDMTRCRRAAEGGLTD